MSTDNPIIGATYTERSTGQEFELAGYRISQQVVMIHDALGPRRTVETISLDQLQESFEYSHCNHDKHCCTMHGHHSVPHQGCIMWLGPRKVVQ